MMSQGEGKDADAIRAALTLLQIFFPFSGKFSILPLRALLLPIKEQGLRKTMVSGRGKDPHPGSALSSKHLSFSR